METTETGSLCAASNLKNKIQIDIQTGSSRLNALQMSWYVILKDIPCEKHLCVSINQKCTNLFAGGLLDDSFGGFPHSNNLRTTAHRANGTKSCIVSTCLNSHALPPIRKLRIFNLIMNWYYLGDVEFQYFMVWI